MALVLDGSAGITGPNSDNDVLINGVTVGKGAGTVSTNTVVGSGALANMTSSGFYDVAIGYNALNTSTSGIACNAIGYRALFANTSGSNNEAMGASALVANTTGSFQVAIGDSALTSNTTGSNNVGIGQSALYSNTTANNNTAVGYQALYASNRTADVYANNTAIGYLAGSAITTGQYNTSVGSYGNNFSTTGSNVTAFGYNCYPGSATDSNCIMIGTNVSGQGAGTFSFGSSGNIVYNTFTSNASWSRSSDSRLKTNVVTETLGLAFINQLRTVKFNWLPSNEVPKELTQHYSETNNNDTTTVMHGFIAQEVKSALDAVGSTDSGIWSTMTDGTQAVSREMFVMPLINAVNELTAQLKTAQATITTMQGQITALQAKVGV